MLENWQRMLRTYDETFTAAHTPECDEFFTENK